MRRVRRPRVEWKLQWRQRKLHEQQQRRLEQREQRDQRSLQQRDERSLQQRDQRERPVLQRSSTRRLAGLLLPAGDLVHQPRGRRSRTPARSASSTAIACAAVAPAAPAGFRSCNWDGEAISYRCGACGIGRVPGDTAPCPEGETVGERLARQAYYEAASVIAFDRLTAARESAHAPPALVERARAAAKDEARHASLFAALAARHGATPLSLAYRAATPSRFDPALENATEGCVRETFGAVVTLHQATYAESAEVRAAFAAIAEDEAEHAGLRGELRTWFDTQLTVAERARVHRAHGEAVAVARRDVAAAPDAAGRALGLPPADRASKMLDALMDAMATAV